MVIRLHVNWTHLGVSELHYYSVIVRFIADFVAQESVHQALNQLAVSIPHLQLHPHLSLEYHQRHPRLLSLAQYLLRTFPGLGRVHLSVEQPGCLLIYPEAWHLSLPENIRIVVHYLWVYLQNSLTRIELHLVAFAQYRLQSDFSTFLFHSQLAPRLQEFIDYLVEEYTIGDTSDSE
jgi:hypothetical protein